MKKILILSFFVCCKIFGQSNNYYFDRAQILRSGNFLGYLNLIEKNLDKNESSQSLAEAHTFVGNYKFALQIYNSKHIEEHLIKDKKVYDLKDYSKFKEIEKNQIFSELNKTDFFLLNEAHHRNYNRIFLRDNLKKLYEIGFRNLFVEALNSVDTINQRKFPVIRSLNYPEPIYGEMLREALLIGFKVYAYDLVGNIPETYNAVEQWNYRENIQYENILKQFDGKKSIIYGGYSHIITNNSGYNDYKFLGALLKSNYSVLSLDQTTFVEENLEKFEKKFYLDNVSKFKTKYFKNDESANYDYTLIHPRTESKEDKPSWLINNKKKGTLTWDGFKKDKTILVQVYKLDEYNLNGDNCISIYQYIEKNVGNDTLPYYFYEKGNEILVIRNSENKILLKRTI